MKLICVLLGATWLVSSCQSEPSASEEVEIVAAAPATTQPAVTDVQTTFQTYLYSGFQQTIPETEHWYVVIPSLGCIGCNIEELKVLAKGPQRPQVTVLAAHLLLKLSALERKRLAQVTQLLADTTLAAPTRLDQLPLPFPAYTGLIRTRAGRVQECIPFNKEDFPAAFARLPGSIARK
ncbi:hypothetical protein [Hymenobacter psychrotolerans]|uniref:Uncharacterized protein n=1 Tax=Hymenobacter psychrotolerans DSM 18569 TaxID=1121959 RepID=A0A1M7B0H9_9BACT|nr:hypothetical protein [Hymenobacter psychrotolerans]SHL48508.1 hypothetical protein SAMN02746009_02823 [Hymenobacter psychrotolerans DSM 18569]